MELQGKSSKQIFQLLKNKYPNPPRYINPKKIHENIGDTDEAIDTDTWRFVIPKIVDGKFTGEWNTNGGSALLTNDWVINKLLSNTNELEEAKIPTNGGRRRAQRKTKVKSKKRANKRRTRSRK